MGAARTFWQNMLIISHFFGFPLAFLREYSKKPIEMVMFTGAMPYYRRQYFFPETPPYFSAFGSAKPRFCHCRGFVSCAFKPYIPAVFLSDPTCGADNICFPCENLKKFTKNVYILRPLCYTLTVRIGRRERFFHLQISLFTSIPLGAAPPVLCAYAGWEALFCLRRSRESFPS